MLNQDVKKLIENLVMLSAKEKRALFIILATLTADNPRFITNFAEIEDARDSIESTALVETVLDGSDFFLKETNFPIKSERVDAILRKFCDLELYMHQAYFIALTTLSFTPDLNDHYLPYFDDVSIKWVQYAAELGAFGPQVGISLRSENATEFIKAIDVDNANKESHLKSGGKGFDRGLIDSFNFDHSNNTFNIVLKPCTHFNVLDDYVVLSNYLYGYHGSLPKVFVKFIYRYTDGHFLWKNETLH